MTFLGISRVPTAEPVQSSDHPPRCAACGEQAPEPLEPFDAAGQATFRCVWPTPCLKRARVRRLGKWAS